MRLLIQPLGAFYSSKLYQEFSKAPSSKGMTYWAYFSIILAFIFTLTFSVVSFGGIDNAVSWFKREMPAVLWNDEGLFLEDKTSPYSMTHERFGRVATFETSRREIREEDAITTELFYFTQTKVYFQRDRGDILSYDMMKPPFFLKKGSSDSARFDLEWLDTFSLILKPLIIMVGIPVFFIFSFVGGLLITALYSIIGILMNLSRKEKYGYAGIYNICLLALTPATLMGSIMLLFPINLADWVFFAATLFYLLFGIRLVDFVSQSESPQE